MLPAVATKVNGGVMTSSPESMPSAIRASKYRVRSRGAGNGEAAADEGRNFRLQLLHFRTHDELLAFQDLVHGEPDIFLHSGVFSPEIEKGEEHFGGVCGVHWVSIVKEMWGARPAPQAKVKGQSSKGASGSRDYLQTSKSAGWAPAPSFQGSCRTVTFVLNAGLDYPRIIRVNRKAFAQRITTAWTLFWHRRSSFWGWLLAAS